MAFLRALKDFACLPDPKTIPPSNLLKYTDTTITLFDKYPKANFHFLVLPRVRPDAGLTTTVLHDLKSLLAWKEKEKALEVLKDLERESKEIQEMVRDEMHKRFGEGCEWKVFTGFHAVPSMQYVCCPPLLLEQTEKVYTEFALQPCSPTCHFVRLCLSITQDQETLEFVQPQTRILPRAQGCPRMVSAAG